MSTDLSWVGQHQAIVAALIVFVGVVFGLIGNAGLQWWDRSSRRDHDRKVMSSALLAELTNHLKLCQEMLDDMMKVQPGTPGSFDMPEVIATEVYDTLLDKIGVLEPEQGSRVIQAYQAVKLLPKHVRWGAKEIVRRAPAEPDPTSDPHEGMMRVPMEAMPYVVRSYQECIDLFKAAIAALRDSR